MPKIGGFDPNKNRIRSTPDAAGAEQTKDAGRTTGAGGVSQAGPTIANEAGGADAKQALRALAMETKAEASEQAPQNAGAESAWIGARFMEALQGPTGRRIGSAAMLGLSLFGTVQTAKADIVYLDLNNGVKEIDAAREMAAKTGEKFVLVRPTTQALDDIFQKAENGEIDLSTLILSGHSIGTSIWGSGPDGTSYQADISDFEALKAKYPKAFDQVQHVFFMSCYSGSEGNSASWNKVFNKARAIVGFYGSGPASSRPASAWTMKNVENALNALPDATLSPQAALLKAKQISSLDGPRHTKFGIRLDGVYHMHGKKTSNTELVMQRTQHERNQTFEPYFDAVAGFENTPTNHQSSPLRNYYNQLQEAVSVVETGSPESAELQKDVATTIRLIYFDNVLKNVQLNNGPRLAEANAQLTEMGADFQIPSDLTKLSRREVLDINAKLQELGQVDLTAAVNGTVKDHEATIKSYLESKDVTVEDSDLISPNVTLSTNVGRVKSLASEVDATYFPAAEKTMMDEAIAGVKAVVEMSDAELDANVLDGAAGMLAAYGEDARAQAVDQGLDVSIPTTSAELKALGVDGVRELAKNIKSATEGLTYYDATDLRELAQGLTGQVGDSNASLRDLSARGVIEDGRSGIRDIGNKLETLKEDDGFDLGWNGGEAESMLKMFEDGRAAMDNYDAPPQDVIDAVAGVREAVDTPAATAVGDAQRVFENGLRLLDADAVPDNWITD